MNKMQTEYFDCECQSAEHVLRFTIDPVEHTLYTEIFLKKWPFWKRFWIGIKYIFGYKSRYGDFASDIIIQREDLDRLSKLVEKVKKKSSGTL